MTDNKNQQHAYTEDKAKAYIKQHEQAIAILQAASHTDGQYRAVIEHCTGEIEHFKANSVIGELEEEHYGLQHLSDYLDKQYYEQIEQDIRYEDNTEYLAEYEQGLLECKQYEVEGLVNKNIKQLIELVRNRRQALIMASRTGGSHNMIFNKEDEY